MKSFEWNNHKLFMGGSDNVFLNLMCFSTQNFDNGDFDCLPEKWSLNQI